MAPSSLCFRASFLTFSLYLVVLILPTQLIDAAAHPFGNCPSVPAELASTHFNVLLPKKTYFKQILDCSEDPKGFVVDVFEAARLILLPNPYLTPYTNVSYHCFNVSSNATYDDMVDCLSIGSFDAVIGDVTITANRSKIASFTLPYIPDSGIVVLAPAVGKTVTFPEIFFAPFTVQVWWTICAYAVFTGFVLWSLERNAHPEFGKGPPKRRIQKVLWFITSLLFFLKRDTIKNPLSKIVLFAWIGLVLLLGSTYIATFSAILTVQKLSPENLTKSTLQNGTIKIGYRPGTNAANYLQRLNISKDRLESLSNPNDFVPALSPGPHKTGGQVAAIVDEVPYVNLFLSGLPDASCTYVIVNRLSKLTNEGIGFAFPTHSTDLAVAFSTAILNLSENGQLLKLQTGAKVNDYKCPTQVQSTQLDLKISDGMFVFLGLVLFICTGIFSANLMCQYIQNLKFTRIRVPLQDVGIEMCPVVDILEENSILGRNPRGYKSVSSPHYLTTQETFS